MGGILYSLLIVYTDHPSFININASLTRLAVYALDSGSIT
jgi:hypothetical protein